MVFNAMGELRPNECDAFPVTGFCTFALMAFLNHTVMISDRVSVELEPELRGIVKFRCPQHGAIGGRVG